MTQLNLPEAIAAKEQGQALVEEHNRGFVEVMRDVAKRFANVNGTVTSDDLREYAEHNGLSPKHPNCWGAVFQGGFVAVSFTKSRFVSNHARWIRVWKLK